MLFCAPIKNSGIDWIGTIPAHWNIKKIKYVASKIGSGNLTLFGTTEDVGDRKYNNGEVVNTLRKFPAEEKAYMAQYDEWKIR